MVVDATIKSRRGSRPVSLDFNDNDTITGNYRVDSNPYRANAPDILGESIKEKSEND